MAPNPADPKPASPASQSKLQADSLFGDDDVVSPAAPPPGKGGVIADITTVTGTTYVVDRTRAWPGMVPARTPSLEVLRGRATATGAEDLTKTFLAGLKPTEQAALASNAASTEALREGIILAWRHRVAMMAMPAAGGEMSRSALDALLNETDLAVKALVVPEGTEAGIAESMNAMRAALSRGAAQLAQAEGDLLRRITQTALPAVKPEAAKLTSMESAAPEEPPKVKKGLRNVAIVVFVIAAVFHGINYFGLFKKGPMIEKALTQLPTGYVQATTKPGAPLIILPALNAGKMTEAQREEKKKAIMEQAKKDGKTVKEIGPGEFVVQ